MSGKSLKIFTATAVAATVFAPVASANTTFKDITPANSHYEAVKSLVERGIINGYEDGDYCGAKRPPVRNFKPLNADN
ncbi:S-layer homology domain-containing protein [Solibacillus sp. FSL W7-1436]|uniref:S-layer homology domain-containing protein n=1 Tax=Solibacillus sp. FSL W7-1436 TaxID=2921705 RepID=UPI0030F5E4D2